MDRPSILVYRSEREPTKLLEQLARIRSLADSNKEALGFLPEAAYREAIEKRRLVAMCTANDGNAEIVGFVLFGGVFPNARIQQVAVFPEHRRAGVASALINSVVSQLEMRGYASGLFSVARTADLTRERKIAELEALFNMTVMDRLVEICGSENCRAALASYDRFLDQLERPEIRDRLKALGKEERSDPLFRELKNEGHHFTRELLKLFEGTFDATHPIRRAIIF